MINDFEIVSIQYREHDFREVPAFRYKDILFRDEQSIKDPNYIRRVFWLLNYQVQMVYDTHLWENEWRIDLVDIFQNHNQFKIVDSVIDIIVEGMGPTYRILDLGEFGEYLINGKLDVIQINTILKNTEVFLESFLHRNAPWPPPCIEPFFSINHNYPYYNECQKILAVLKPNGNMLSTKKELKIT